jgi:hypothetical protein
MNIRLLGWIGLGVVSGGLITGIAIGSATAASPSPSPSPYGYQQPGPRIPGLPGMPGRGRMMHRFGEGPGDGFGPLGGDVLHSEATVKEPDGTTKVVVTQSGDITDITDSTVTVKSSDGFLATYTIDKNTRIALNGTDGALSSLKKGDTVHVAGTKSGATNHADAVDDGMPPHFD